MFFKVRVIHPGTDRQGMCELPLPYTRDEDKSIERCSFFFKYSLSPALSRPRERVPAKFSSMLFVFVFEKNQKQIPFASLGHRENEYF